MSDDLSAYQAQPTALESVALVPYPSILIDGERMLVLMGIQQSPGRLVQTAEDLQDELGEEFGPFRITRQPDGKPDIIGLTVDQFVRICAHYGFPASGALRNLIGAHLQVRAADESLRTKILAYLSITSRTRSEIRTRFIGVPLDLLSATLDQMVLSGEITRASVQRGMRGPKAEIYSVK